MKNSRFLRYTDTWLELKNQCFTGAEEAAVAAPAVEGGGKAASSIAADTPWAAGAAEAAPAAASLAPEAGLNASFAQPSGAIPANASYTQNALASGAPFNSAPSLTAGAAGGAATGGALGTNPGDYSQYTSDAVQPGTVAPPGASLPSLGDAANIAKLTGTVTGNKDLSTLGTLGGVANLASDTFSTSFDGSGNVVNAPSGQAIGSGGDPVNVAQDGGVGGVTQTMEGNTIPTGTPTAAQPVDYSQYTSDAVQPGTVAPTPSATPTPSAGLSATDAAINAGGAEASGNVGASNSFADSISRAISKTGNSLSTSFNKDPLSFLTKGAALGSGIYGLTAGANNAQKYTAGMADKTAALGAPASAVGQQLLQQYQSGQLGPADQQRIDSWAAAQKAATKAYFDKAQLSTSPMAIDALAQIDSQANAMKDQAMQAMMQSGLSALNVGAGPVMASINQQIQGNQAAQQSQAAFLKALAQLGAGTNQTAA